MTAAPPGPVVAVISRHAGSAVGVDPAVAEGLRQRGLTAHLLPDGAPEAMQADVILLLGGPSSLRRSIRRIERAGHVTPPVVAWLFEPLPPPDLPVGVVRAATRFSAIRTGRRWMRPLMQALARPGDWLLARRVGRGISASNLRFAIDTASIVFRGTERGWLTVILVSTEQKRRQLADWGLTAEFLPVGQQPRFGRDLGLARDIDVLFIGSLKSRRRRAALDGLVQALRARGLAVHVPEAAIWGEARSHLVNRARIVLHLHQFDWDTPWMRWYLAEANGAVVASEPLSVPAPLRPGIDYLEAPLHDLAARIAELAGDEPRRLAMLHACRAQIGKTLTQDRALDRLACLLRDLAGGREAR